MRDVLNVSTAGSVDDGKSTLIGRLLFETHNIPTDQLQQLETGPGGERDYARVTDGLKAEREQGITIDVAFRYLNTPERRIVLADSPGHAEYTRNMATAASGSDCAVILIDAVRGIREQSKRHALIAITMATPHLIVVINKMDLVDFSQSVFAGIEAQFQRYLSELGTPHARFIPVSALRGDSVVTPSKHMTWYRGPTLLEALQSTPVRVKEKTQAMRLPIQLVARTQKFRGISGTVASGQLAVGDDVVVLPADVSARVASIHTARGNRSSVQADTAVTVTLDRELDVGRGDLLVHPSARPQMGRQISASIVWFHTEPLRQGREVLLKQATSLIPARIQAIDHVLDVETLQSKQSQTLALNELGKVSLDLNRRLALDLYANNRTTGSFILIDPLDNHTLAAGMILQVTAEDGLVDIETNSVVIVGEFNRLAFATTLSNYLNRAGRASLILNADEHPESLDAAVRQVSVTPLWVKAPPSISRDSNWEIRFEAQEGAEKIQVIQRKIIINQTLVGPEEAALLVARHWQIGGER